MKCSKLKVDDQEYLLGYDFNDLADAESVVGCNLLSGLGGNASAQQLRGIIYAMTRQTHPKLTLTDAGNLLRFDVAAQAITVIGEACALSVSDEYAEAFRAAMKSDDDGQSKELAAGGIVAAPEKQYVVGE